MTTGAEGGRPKRSSNTVGSSVFGQVEPGSAPAGIRQAVNPARAERRRRLRLWSGSAQAFGLDHRRVPRVGIRIARMRQAYGSRGRGLSPCVPHALFKGCERKKTGKPWGRSEHGAMTRAWMYAPVGLFDN